MFSRHKPLPPLPASALRLVPAPLEIEADEPPALFTVATQSEKQDNILPLVQTLRSQFQEFREEAQGWLQIVSDGPQNETTSLQLRMITLVITSIQSNLEWVDLIEDLTCPKEEATLPEGDEPVGNYS
jgi:hypothetical protein